LEVVGISIAHVGLIDSRLICSALLADVWQLHKFQLLWTPGRAQPLSEVAPWRDGVKCGSDAVVVFNNNKYYRELQYSYCQEIWW